MSQIKIVYKKTSDLIAYAKNSRTHDNTQVSQIAASIKEFGFTNPVLVDSKNEIIAGHGRVLAAKKLKIVDVPTIELSNLTDIQKRAYVIADNKIALNSGWDDNMLKSELEALDAMDFDITITGFTLEEFNLDIEEGKTEEDDAPEVAKNILSVKGDVWLCGEHRVMCGDSIVLDDVEKLTQKQKIDMIFTDPPYNVAFNGRSGNHDVIKNDKLSKDDFKTFIDDFVGIVKIINPNHYYIWCNWNFYGVLQGVLDYKACIVWAKNVFGLGIGYRHQHEFCLFNGKIDEEVKNESDLWQIKKDSNYVHPTQKPVALSDRAFGNHSDVVNVLDLFGGSGSTLIGAQKNKKTAFIMELDEMYVDVIVKRWQDFTGKKATLESSGLSFDDMFKDKFKD